MIYEVVIESYCTDDSFEFFSTSIRAVLIEMKENTWPQFKGLMGSLQLNPGTESTIFCEDDYPYLPLCREPGAQTVMIGTDLYPLCLTGGA